MQKDIFLLTGSNLGDRLENLKGAIELLKKRGVVLCEASSIYETAPWGKEDQPDFLNQLLRVESALSPDGLLRAIHEIESEMGRVRKEKWESRTIDIDIIFYGQRQIDTPGLVVPHPGVPNRRFVLLPLCELVPDFLHPVLELSMEQLLKNCNDPLEAKVFES